MKKVLLFLLVVTGLFACNQKTVGDKSTDATEAKENATNHFGEKISADGALAFDELVSKMEGSDSMLVKVRGKVEDVCQAKGCWMNIVSDNTDAKMFVKFKDYGFFMPKDIAGEEVIMEGYAYREITSVDELRHYAEDKGKSAEEIAAITEPKEEFKFMASGVILLEKGM